MNIKSLLLPIVLSVCTQAAAQEFKWEMELTTQFDNREYKSEFTMPQTLFGARFTPEAGVGWAGGHSLMLAVTALEEFGAKSLETDPELMFYYNYNTSRYNISAGRFPRRQAMGDYPASFFSDSVRFFDANMDGLLMQLKGDRGFVEFACDWDSRQSEERREKFTLFSAGRIKRGIFYAGYHFSMHHHAGIAQPESEAEDNVVDNVWVSYFLGMDLSGRSVWFDKLDLRLGQLRSFQNDRTHVGEYVAPHGVEIGTQAEKHGFGISNTLFAGDDMMPYYDRYGGGLYWGDPYYRTTNDIYDRLEIYWQPRLSRGSHLKVASVHHYDGKRWDWQQFITFSVNLSKDMFRRNRPAGSLSR